MTINMIFLKSFENKTTTVFSAKKLHRMSLTLLSRIEHFSHFKTFN